MRTTAGAALVLLTFTACAKQEPSPPPAASSPTTMATTGPASRATDKFPTSKGELTVTPIHHASLVLAIGDKAIFLDPTKDGSIEGLPKADYVFVTDIHPDHLDDAGIARVKKDGTVLVGPAAVDAKTKMNVVLANGETHDFGAFSVQAVPMYNLQRGPEPGKLFHDKGRGNGYVFTFGSTRVYDSGDTECTPEMKALTNIDVAFVCMNLPYTMPPSEAAECVNAFKPKVVFPFHYRGSNLEEFTSKVAPGIEVRKRSWY